MRFVIALNTLNNGSDTVLVEGAADMHEAIDAAVKDAIVSFGIPEAQLWIESAERDATETMRRIIINRASE